MASFNQQVYDLVALIPPGRVMSYGQIARALGNPKGARQVGWAMHHCPEGLPWQRVVMADGSIAAGEYAEMRRCLLEDEGVTFGLGNRVDMRRHGWHP